MTAFPYSRPGGKMPDAPPDEPARRRIREDLDTNFLVEAGAGSGKTTSLVSRMVALVRSGACNVDQIAAVTFTRMAAAELRQRFQEELEGALRELDGDLALRDGSTPAADHRESAGIRAREDVRPDDADVRERLRRGVRDIEKAFLGTIHSFCAKLLRERPLEAGLDPGFTELQEVDAARARAQFWPDFLERLAADGDPRLRRLDRMGVSPAQLQGAFREMVDNPDVDFVGEKAPPPGEAEVGALRGMLDRLLDQAEQMIWGRKAPNGWDPAAKRIKTLLYKRKAGDWQDPAVLFDAVSRLNGFHCTPTQYKWADDAAGKQRAKQLGVDITKFGSAASPAIGLLKRWWAHRYPVALSVARDAAAEFASQRRREGMVTFEDLLVLTARLLRTNPRARRELGERYPRILVDEFQDTDPLQAEIVLLLASDPDRDSGGKRTGPAPNGGSPGAVEHPQEAPPSVAEWQTARPRPGALFVVGDPKQSIYRFRRADIGLYDTVKRRFEDFGEVLSLESNFRSLSDFGALVEGVFRREDRFPDRDSELQAAYAPLVTRTLGRGLLATYPVNGRRQDDIVLDDAAKIASEIARRVGRGPGDGGADADRRSPGDFLVLTHRRKELPVYARALEDRNLPVAVSGAGAGFEDELAAFLLLLKCLHDPAHQVRILGVLTGPLFGITLDRIVRHTEAMRSAGRGRWLAADRPPPGSGPPRGSGRSPGSDMQKGGGEPLGRDSPIGDGEISNAMDMLYKWWRRASREPADITVERLADEIGLFPVAAADALGEVRAGALTYALDAVRARTLAGDASLAGAIQAIEAAIDSDEADTPLIPGRPNCVRVMNLHKAKGLEADIVFLAAPFGQKKWPPKRHVRRGDSGVAQGTAPIVIDRGFNRTEVIAQPLDWERDAEREQRFEECERVRLLYVAATRAKHELWIAHRRQEVKKVEWQSKWKVLEDWVRERAEGSGGGAEPRAGTTQKRRPNLAAAGAPSRGAGPVCVVAELKVDPAPTPDRLDPGIDLAGAIAEARNAVSSGGVPTYRLESVTARAKPAAGAKPAGGPNGGEAGTAASSTGAGPGEERPPTGSGATAGSLVVDADAFLPGAAPGSGGLEWGSVVHDVLAAAAEGIGGDALVRLARDLLVDHGRPLDATGAPRELDALLGLVEAVSGSQVWRRAMASPERHVEIPFAVNVAEAPNAGSASPAAAPPPPRSAGVRGAGARGAPDVVEGVIDLVFKEGDHWVVADYKTDSGDDPDFAGRVGRYRAQVDLYAECWERLTGESVGERVLLFTTQGRSESW